MDAVATMADQAAQAGVRVILCLIPPQTRTGETLAYDGYTGDPAVRAWNRDLSLLAAAHGDQVADYDSVLVNPDGTQNQALFMPMMASTRTVPGLRRCGLCWSRCSAPMRWRWIDRGSPLPFCRWLIRILPPLS